MLDDKRDGVSIIVTSNGVTGTNKLNTFIIMKRDILVIINKINWDRSSSGERNSKALSLLSPSNIFERITREVQVL